MTGLTHNTDASLTFLAAVFNGPGATDGLIELVHDDETNKHLTGRHRSRALTQISQAVAKAAELTAKHRRVYFGAGVRSASLPFDRPSLDSDVTAWPALVWDCDNLEASTYCLEKAKELDLGFHFVVQTGQFRNNGKPDLRVQCWVLLDKPCFDLDRVKRVLQRGIQVFGSDKSIHDSRRVMRLPGSISWGLKDGRQDEPVILRDDLAEIRGRYTIEEIEAILDGAEVAPVREVNQERVTEIRERIVAAGTASAIWRESPAVNVMISDLLDGIEMNPSLFQLAVLAARDGHPADRILASLQELLSQSDGIVQRPDRVEALERQLPSLVRRAVADAGLGSTATPYVEAVRELPPIERGSPEDDEELDARETMFRDFAWCEPLSRAIELRTGAMLDRTQLDARCWEVGPIGRAGSAWNVFLQHGDQRRDVVGLTFRPGMPGLVRENLPSLQGLCVNTWKPPRRKLPADVLDADIPMFLELGRFVIPDDEEREITYNAMAWAAQNPAEKPSWALVMGSTYEGIGKDSFLAPLQVAIGTEYCRTINASELLSDFNGYMKNCRLLLVNEMSNFEKTKMSNILKPLIAAPPHTIRVNDKNDKAYETPNTCFCVFSTNEDAAIRLNSGARRYFITWNSNPPREPEFYERLWAWLNDGGSEKVAAWLMERDVSKFNAKGRAPETAARAEMIKDSRSGLEEWIYDGIESGQYPFDADLCVLEDVRQAIPKDVLTGPRPTAQRLRRIIERAGAVRVTEQIRLGWTMATTKNDRGIIYAVRRKATYLKLQADGEVGQLKTLFKDQYDKAGAARVRSEFSAA